MIERDLDVLLRLVADQRRRQIVQYLRHEATGKTTVDDLVDRLHNCGADDDDRPIDREELAIQLHHVHLPTLADHGIVAFNRTNRAVRYQPDKEFESVLDSLPNERFTARV